MWGLEDHLQHAQFLMAEAMNQWALLFLAA